MRAVGVKQVTETVKQVGGTFNDALDNASRGVKQLRRSAEDVLDETRHTIKSRPFAAVGTAAGAGFAVGILLGWFWGRGSRR